MNGQIRLWSAALISQRAALLLCRPDETETANHWYSIPVGISGSAIQMKSELYLTTGKVPRLPAWLYRRKQQTADHSRMSRQ